jgi:hypothetical protein
LLARQALGFSEFDYEEAGAFEQADDDMNARLHAEFREAHNG